MTTSRLKDIAYEDDLKKRAFAAYYRRTGEFGDRPEWNDSTLGIHNGKEYIVLRNLHRNDGSIVAVYRVRPKGVLKGLKRYPEELGQD
jgi:hypothetical protein